MRNWMNNPEEFNKLSEDDKLREATHWLTSPPTEDDAEEKDKIFGGGHPVVGYMFQMLMGEMIETREYVKTAYVEGFQDGRYEGKNEDRSAPSQNAGECWQYSDANRALVRGTNG